MNPIPRNTLAVLAGALACMLLNGLLLEVLMVVNPPPPGFDPNDLTTFELLEPKHLLNAFVAHAIPSLVGGAIAALIALSRKVAMALIVGGVHLLGGIAAAFMIPAPGWFIALDLSMAYLPMAWIGARVISRAH